MFYRPEAVHLGDLLRIRVRPGVKITLPPSDFQGPTPTHRTPREARRFTDATSLSLDKPIPGSPLLTKKRELFPGSTLASPSSVALPRWGPRARSPPPGSGILTRFPFDRIGLTPPAGSPVACAALRARRLRHSLPASRARRSVLNYSPVAHAPPSIHRFSTVACAPSPVSFRRLLRVRAFSWIRRMA